MKTRDSIGRRYRDRPVPTGKRISLTDRDLLCTERLHWHGPLSSEYLRHYSRVLRKSDQSATKRFCDLANEDQTAHGGVYWGTPHQQFMTLDPRKNFLVFDIATSAEIALKEYKLWSDYTPKAGRAWTHEFSVAAVTAAIELGTIRDENVRYIPGHEILERAQTHLSFPTRVSGKEVKLLPDGLFGLEYTDSNKKYYRFFILELDRGTEPVSGITPSRKSHERNVEQYKQFVAGGQYKDALGLSAGIMVLYVTISEGRMNNLMEVTDNNYSCFAHVPEFGSFFQPPSVLYHLFRDGWKRHNRDVFHINNIDGNSPKH
jgi:hypothetical protein